MSTIVNVGHIQSEFDMTILIDYPKKCINEIIIVTK